MMIKDSIFHTNRLFGLTQEDHFQLMFRRFKHIQKYQYDRVILRKCLEIKLPLLLFSDDRLFFRMMIPSTIMMHMIAADEPPTAGPVMLVCSI